MLSNEYKFRLAFAENSTAASPKLAVRKPSNQALQECLRQLAEPAEEETQELGQCLADTIDCLQHSLCSDDHIPNLHEITWFLKACQSFYDQYKVLAQEADEQSIDTETHSADHSAEKETA